MQTAAGSTDIEPSSQSLRWTDTLARSGRLKDVSSVFGQHQSAPRQPSRKRYNIRFDCDRSATRTRLANRRKRPRRDIPASSPSNDPPLLPSPRSPPSLLDSATTTDDALDQWIGPSLCFDTEPAVVADTSFLYQDSIACWPPEEPNGPVASTFLIPEMGLASALSCDRSDLHRESQPSFPHVAGNPDTSLTLFQQHLQQLPEAPTGFTPTIIPPNPDAYPLASRNATGDSVRYLQFFIEKCVPRFSPLWNTLDNPFTSVIIPGSLEFPILLHAVCAVSASQAPSHDDDADSEAYKALWHKQRVIDYLLKDAAESASPSVPNLIACILVQSLEVVKSGVRGWQRWLEDALLIIKCRDRLGYDLLQESTWSALSKCLVAMETLASITADRDVTLSLRYWELYLESKPSIDDPRLSDEDIIYAKCEEESFFEKHLGCSAVTLLVLAEISFHLRSRNLGTAPSTPATTVDRQLLKWEDLLMRPSAGFSDQSSYHLMEAFRYAALVQYLRRARGVPYTSSIVQNNVRSALQELFSINVSQFGVVAVWPMMLAGLELNESEYTQLAATLLRKVREGKTNWGKHSIFSKCEMLLMLVWDKRKNCETWQEMVDCDWLDISMQQGWEWCFW